MNELYDIRDKYLHKESILLRDWLFSIYNVNIKYDDIYNNPLLSFMEIKNINNFNFTKIKILPKLSKNINIIEIPLCFRLLTKIYELSLFINFPQLSLDNLPSFFRDFKNLHAINAQNCSDFSSSKFETINAILHLDYLNIGLKYPNTARSCSGLYNLIGNETGFALIINGEKINKYNITINSKYYISRIHHNDFSFLKKFPYDGDYCSKFIFLSLCKSLSPKTIKYLSEN